MRVLLLNSAVMPREGIYVMKRITKEEFGKALKQAKEKGVLKSYIGYPDNIELIKKWFGVEVELNRTQTDVKNGDIMLVMKLKYRLPNPKDKGRYTPKEEDFEFFTVQYREA